MRARLGLVSFILLTGSLALFGGACGDEDPAFAGAGGAGGVGGAGGGGGEPNAVPEISSIHPRDGAEEVPRNARIRLTFTAAMNPAETEAAVELRHEDATVEWLASWHEGDTVLEIVPVELFRPMTRVQVVVSPSAVSREGEPLRAAFMSSFTTSEALHAPGEWDSMSWDQNFWQ